MASGQWPVAKWMAEFGLKVRARSVTAGGEGENPRPAHFSGQAKRSATGDWRGGNFYPQPLPCHSERGYRPGE